MLGHPEVEAALARAADVSLARSVLDRVLEADPSVADDLVERATVRDALVAVACASRSLSNALVADPSLVALLRDLDGLPAALPPPEPGTLRRWKRGELLRIAAADLLGLADLPTVGRRLATLADACLALALEAVAPTGPFAVVGMGKLGGRGSTTPATSTCCSCTRATGPRPTGQRVTC